MLKKCSVHACNYTNWCICNSIPVHLQLYTGASATLYRCICNSIPVHLQLYTSASATLYRCICNSIPVHLQLYTGASATLYWCICNSILVHLQLYTYRCICNSCLFSGLYGVGKAAVHPPALAVLSHTPEGATKTIAWVGKGIVYDTGGLSIKGKVSVRCNWNW